MSKSLLLQAALLEPAEALAAFLLWKSQTDFEKVDSDFLLLPSVFKNLERLLKDDDLEPRLRGIYKQAWLRQQLLAQHQRGLTDHFLKLGISVFILDDPSTDLLAAADVIVNCEAATLQKALPNNWKRSFNAARWNHQHQAQLELSDPRDHSVIRLFKTSICDTNELWLHRLEHCPDDFVWLLRFIPNALMITPLLEKAKARGLTRRLETTLEFAVRHRLLEPSFDGLSGAYSKLENAQYWRVHAGSRIGRFWADYQTKRLLGDPRPLLELLTDRWQMRFLHKRRIR